MDSLVSSTHNPCKAIWDEYKAGKLNLEEMLTAVYSFALTDPNCNYNYMASPPKPSDLEIEERKFKQLSDGIEDIGEKRKAYAKFKDHISEKYKSYFSKFSELAALNSSNLHFAQEMHEFFKGKNPAFERKTHEIIQTHRYGIFQS